MIKFGFNAEIPACPAGRRNPKSEFENDSSHFEEDPTPGIPCGHGRMPAQE